MDPYSICPSGSGEKVKFCCPKLIGEYEKLATMQRDQPSQTARKVQRLIDKHGPTMCLLRTKAICALKRDDQAALTEATTAALEINDQVDWAHALLSLTVVWTDLLQAIEHLEYLLPPQSQESVHYAHLAAKSIALAAIEKLPEGAPAAVTYTAIESWVAVEEGETSSWEKLMANPFVLPSVKGDYGLNEVQLSEDEANSPWAETFRAANRDTQDSRFLASYRQLEPWLDREDCPHRILWFGAWLAAVTFQTARARELLERILHKTELDFESRVDAAGLLQGLADHLGGETCPTIMRTYAVTDGTALAAQITGHPQFVDEEIDRDEYGDDPVPEILGELLDRPPPEPDDQGSFGEPSLDDLPIQLCRVSIFGKRTDREAQIRIDFPLIEGQEERVRELLSQLELQGLGELISEDRSAEFPVELAWREYRYMPNVLEWSRQGDRLQLDKERQVLRGFWLNAPSSVLGGRTPREAVADEVLKPHVAAWLEHRQVSRRYRLPQEEWDAIRQELGLPIPPPVPPDRFDPSWLSPLALRRVNPSELDDDQLNDLSNLVTTRHLAGLIAPVTEEELRRCPEDAPDDSLRIPLFVRLVRNAWTFDEAEARLKEARTAMPSEEHVPLWDILEFQELARRQLIDETAAFGRSMLERYQHIPQILAPVLDWFDMVTGGRISEMYQQSTNELLQSTREGESSFPPSRRPHRPGEGPGLILPR